MVLRERLELSRPFGQRIFLLLYVAIAIYNICFSLDYTFSISNDLGGHRLVSTPSSYEAWLGIIYLRVPPNLMAFTLWISHIGAPEFVYHRYQNIYENKNIYQPYLVFYFVLYIYYNAV